MQVSITRKQNPLPPQLSVYHENPGRFFNVSVTNIDPETAIPVRLEVSLVGPIEGGADAWPVGPSSYFTMNYNQSLPSSFIIQPKQSKFFTSPELSNHLMSYPNTARFMGGRIADALQNTNDGRPFGLLDEGHYGIKVTAKSNFAGDGGDVLGEGYCFFDICYAATAPEFTRPATNSNGFDFTEAYQTINFPTDYAHFEWTVPAFNMPHLALNRQFSYDFKLYRMLPNQSPEEAIGSAAIAFQQPGLMVPYCDIPVNVVTNLKRSGYQYYVAQVTATPVVAAGVSADYTLINNHGKSQYMVLKIDPEQGGGGGSTEKDITVQDGPTDGDPIKVTVEPKFKELTHELEPYFTEPAKLFRVTLENTTNEDFTISMLFQFFKDNWGVCPAPAKQHANKAISIAAGQTLTLSDEQVNYLAGGYNYSDVIAFKAKTGFIIGKPAQNTFPEKDYTLSARVCRFTGKPVLREEVLGKGRVDFSTAVGIEAGDVFRIDFTTKMNPMPSNTDVLFTKPSRVFSAEIENLSTLSYEVFPVLRYQLEDGVIFMGAGYEERFDKSIAIAPGEKIVLTGDKFDEICGNFEKVRMVTFVDPVPADTISKEDFGLIKSSVSEDIAELTLLDANTIRQLYEHDDAFDEKAFLQNKLLEYTTSPSTILSDIDVFIKPKLTEMPENASAYFLKTYELFEVTLTNQGERAYDLTLNLKYKITEGSDIHVASIPDWFRRSIHLEPGESHTLTEAEHKLFFGSNRVEHYSLNEDDSYELEETLELYKNIDNILDLSIDMENLSFAHIDVYNQELLERIEDTNFGTSRPAILGQGDCDFAITPFVYVHDVTVKMTPLLDPMPGKGDVYINKTANLFTVTLTNTTDETIKAFPIIRYSFEDEDYHYAPAIRDLYQDYITLDPRTPVTLSTEQMNRYLSGTKGVRYDRTGENKPDTLDTFEGLVNLEDFNFGGIAIIDIDSLNKYKGQNLPDFEARVVRGGARQPFMADPDVSLDDVIVKITPLFDRMPENGDPYVLSPGRLFKIELTNSLDRVVKVRPSFSYKFTDVEGEFYVPYNEEFAEGDSVFTLAPLATRTLTASEINYTCGGNRLLHFAEGQDKPDTLRVFMDLVRLLDDNKATFDAYDREVMETLDESDPEFVEKVRLGSGSHTFRGTEGVGLDLVDVEVKHGMNPMSGNGNYYSRMPGRLFEITLTNNTAQEQYVVPAIEYYFGNGESYHRGNLLQGIKKPIQLKPSEKRTLTTDEINSLCGGTNYLLHFANDKVARGDTIRELTDLVALNLFNEARVVAYDVFMLEVVHEDPSADIIFRADKGSVNAMEYIEASEEYLEGMEQARLGSGKTRFEASNGVVLSDIEVTIVTKTPDMSEEAMPYFTEPGKYFDISLRNHGIDDATFGLRLTLNDKYYGVTDSVFTLQPDTLMKLTEEQVNNLCGMIKPERIYQLDTVDNVINRNLVKGEMKLSDINNNVKALVWNLPYGREMSTTADNVDTLSVGVASFVTGFKQIKVGEFYLTPSELERGKADSCYSGKGYITWNAMGFPIKIAVEFDTLYVNKDAVAYRGLVKSAKKEETLNLIPYDLFENKIDSLGAGELGTEVKNMLAGSDFARYYQYATEAMDAIPMTFVDGSAALQLPVKLPESISKKSPVDIQLLSMEFLPDKASMNLIAQFTLPESNYVSNAENILVFGAPHLGMSDSTLVPESGDLALLTDLTIKDPSTGFNITFLAPSSTNLDEGSVDLDNDGCFVTWEKGEFGALCIDAKMAIPSADIVKVVDGTVQEGTAPDIRLTALIEDKEDWIGQVSFDAFEHVDAPGYQFTIGGSEVGVLYDHSKTKSARGMTIDHFPKEYDWALTGVNVKSSKDKMFKEWQGFYFEKLAVAFPEFIEINNSDSGNRLTIAAESIIYDNSGFSMALKAKNVLDLSTEEEGDEESGSLGGWKIAIDDINLAVVQSRFDSFGFSGRFAVPLLEGDIAYDAKVAYVDKAANKPEDQKPEEQKPQGEDTPPTPKEKSLKVVFETRQVDGLSLDFFVGTMDFEKENTYFNVTYFDDTTTVELCLSGEINIGKEKDEEADPNSVSFSLPGIGFHKMRVANFVSKEEIEGNAYHFETADQSFCFDLGRWSLGGITLGGGGGSGGSGNNDQTNNSGSENNNNSGSGNANNNNSGSGNNNNANENKSEDEQKKIDSDVEYGLNIAGFAIGLEEFSIETRTEGEETHFGLYVNAKMSLMEMISASAGLTIWASFDMDTKNAEYKETTFNDVSVEASMGGMYLKGVLKVDNNEKFGDGYAGMLEMTLPGDLFSLNAEGGYYRKEQTDTEASNYGEKYSWGYFNVAVGSSALKAMTPVSISEIAGGFYFNCRTTGKENSNGMKEVEPSYGMIGAMLGVGLAVADESTMAGYFDMLFFYDMEADRLSKIQFTGRAHVMGGGTHKDGAINADALIIYENTIDNAKNTGRKYLQITVTVDGKANMEEMAKKMIAGYMPMEIDAIQAGLEGAFGQDDQDRADAGAEQSKDGDEAAAKSQLKASAGMHVNLDFLVEFKSPTNPDEVKWHLWIGKPQPESERCSVTFIDFQLGEKEDAIATWAKVWVNAYLCIGNDLPIGDDGNILPPIPAEVQEFLDGTDMQGNTQALSSAANQKRNDAVTKLLQSGVKGGMLFGAAAGANFGANMMIAYFDVTAMAGFDIALVKLAGDGTKCSNTGRTMRGINGYYATGQAYAMLQGEIGLMIDLWLFQGKISLVDAGLGALMQVGFAHPTWFYGKARAKCSLFNGLIKFNQAIEIEAGDVCVPYYASPLSDIQIFGATYPEYDLKNDGWEEDKKISPYAIPRFTTNMMIGTEIRLLDETAYANLEANGEDTSGEGSRNAERTYRFMLENNHFVEEYANPNSSRTGSYYVQAVNNSGDRTNYTLKLGALKPDTCYAISLYGHAEEKVNGVWGNPVFCDEESNYKNERRYWGDTCTFYFRTESLPPYLTDNDIAIAPGNSKLNSAPAFYSDLQRPWISMKRSRSELFKSGHDMMVRIEKRDYDFETESEKWSLVDEAPIQEYVETDDQGKFITWRATENLDINSLKTKSEHCRIRIVSIDRSRFNQYMKDATEKFVKETIQYEKSTNRDELLGSVMRSRSARNATSTTKTMAGTTSKTMTSKGTGVSTSLNRNLDASGLVPIATKDEETVNLGAIFEGFENEMVTERQKDEIERKVKEFEQSIDMSAFTEVIYEYSPSYRESETMNLYLTQLKSANKAGDFQEAIPSGLDVLLVSIGDKYANKNDYNFLNGSTLAYKNPYTAFAYLSSYAFFPGYTLRKHEYDQVVSKVTSSQSAEVYTASQYNAFANSPKFSGEWIYGDISSAYTFTNPYLTGLNVTKTSSGDYTTSFRVDENGDKKVYFKNGVQTYYQFEAWKKKMQPRTFSSSTLSYSRLYYPEFDYVYYMVRQYMEAQAYTVQKLTEDVKAATEGFETAAVKERTATSVEVDAEKARKWSENKHNSPGHGSMDSNGFTFECYQIPYVYAMANKKVSSDDMPSYLSTNVYDPMKVIKMLLSTFDGKAYLKGIPSMTFKILSPNGFNINDNDGTTDSGLVVREQQKGSNTFTYTIEKPFDDYTYELY